VLRSAREGGRVEAHHRMAARMLEKRYGPTARGVAERVGRHSVQGGLLVDALGPLLAGAKEHLEQSSYATAHVLLNERLAALEKIGLPESDHRFGENWAMRARLFVEEGDYEQALVYAAKIAARDDDDRWAAMAPHALVVQGTVASKLGQYDEALTRFEKARAQAVRRGDFALVVECLSGIGDAHYYSGRLAHAAETFGAALAQCERARDEKGMAIQLWNEAYVALWRGEATKARALLERQQDLATRIGHRFLLGAGRNGLGDVARVEGKHDDAARRYEEALDLLEGIGSGKRRVVKVNQALNELGRGDVPRAERMIEAIVDELERSGERVLISLAHGVLAAAAAQDGDWSLYDHHLEPFLAPQRGAGLKDGEHAMLVELLAEAAMFTGQPARARAAFVAADEAWGALGREDRAAAAREAIEAKDEGGPVRLTRRPLRA
jgi:tetratricopeptide (TPR) repeat protein